MNAFHDMPEFSGDPQEVLDYVKQWEGVNPFGMAAQFLWDGKRKLTYRDNKWVSIGCALDMALRMKKISPAQHFICKRMVTARLRGHMVNAWLRHQPGVERKHLTKKNVQFFRHRWLDQLAKEWAEGVRS